MRWMIMVAAGAILLAGCNQPQLSASQIQAKVSAQCSVYQTGSQAQGACVREYTRLEMGGQIDNTSLYVAADLSGAMHCNRLGYNSAHKDFPTCVSNYRDNALRAAAVSMAISAATPAPSRPVVMPSSPTTCHGMTVGTISTAHCF